MQVIFLNYRLLRFTGVEKVVKISLIKRFGGIGDDFGFIDRKRKGKKKENSWIFESINTL